MRKATGASIVAARQPYNKIYIMDGIGVANHRQLSYTIQKCQNSQLVLHGQQLHTVLRKF